MGVYKLPCLKVGKQTGRHLESRSVGELISGQEAIKASKESVKCLLTWRINRIPNVC